MPVIVYNGCRLQYRLHATPRLKTLALRVSRDGGVDVRVPKFVKHAQVRQFVRKRAVWILEKRHYFSDLLKRYPPKEFKNGETFPVLGRNYRFKLGRKSGLQEPICKPSGRRLQVTVDGQVGDALKTAVRQAIREWYGALTEKTARAVIRRHVRALAVKPGRLKVVDQAKRWASCSKNGDIRCNWRLSMMPMPVLEYVVVHELCHLKTHDHSPRFWRILKSVLPDYEKRREWLRKEGPTLALDGGI